MPRGPGAAHAQAGRSLLDPASRPAAHHVPYTIYPSLTLESAPRRAAFLSILLSNVTTGIAGLLISTALLVVFAEIIPQSICSRHGLRLGAYTSWLIKFFMVALLPLAWPLAFVLDKARAPPAPAAPAPASRPRRPPARRPPRRPPPASPPSHPPRRSAR